MNARGIPPAPHNRPGSVQWGGHLCPGRGMGRGSTVLLARGREGVFQFWNRVRPSTLWTDRPTDTENIASPMRGVTKFGATTVKNSTRENLSRADSVPLSDIDRCRWIGGECGVSDFVTTLTELGVCYTFNSRTPVATVNESGEIHSQYF